MANVVGYLARKPKEPNAHDRQLSQRTPVSAPVQELYDEDLADGGYVWNVSRLWAHQPDTLRRLFELMSGRSRRAA